MTTFTIDTENNITAFAASDQAEAVIAAGAQPFATSEELTQVGCWLACRALACHLEQPAGSDPGQGIQEPQGRCQQNLGPHSEHGRTAGADRRRTEDGTEAQGWRTGR